MQPRRVGQLEEVLRGVPGMGELMVRSLLTYAGGGDFVQGDEHVQHFVSDSIGRDAVPAEAAGHLVRNAAYEMLLSTRYLEHWIRQSAR